MNMLFRSLVNLLAISRENMLAKPLVNMLVDSPMNVLTKLLVRDVNNTIASRSYVF